MTIEMLDKGTILVSLADRDLQQYALRFDDNTDNEPGLKNLLYRVGEVCGLDHRGKSYLIEALPSAKGCLLIISVHAVKRQKRYRIKRSRTRELCVLFHTDALLDFLQTETGGGFSVYRYKEHYVLLPGASMSGGRLARLSEYGELYPVSEAVFARVREHGRLLLQEKPQGRHIGGRAVAVRNAASGSAGGTGDDLA